jgi:hypothetical protein
LCSTLSCWDAAIQAKANRGTMFQPERKLPQAQAQPVQSVVARR